MRTCSSRKEVSERRWTAFPNVPDHATTPLHAYSVGTNFKSFDLKSWFLKSLWWFYDFDFKSLIEWWFMILISNHYFLDFDFMFFVKIIFISRNIFFIFQKHCTVLHFWHIRQLCPHLRQLINPSLRRHKLSDITFEKLLMLKTSTQ